MCGGHLVIMAIVHACALISNKDTNSKYNLAIARYSKENS